MTRALYLVLLLAACDDCGSPAVEPVADPLPADRGLQSTTAFADIEDERARSVALMEEMGKVLLHPRCVNCHPVGERPLQGEDGMPHQPHVVRGEGGHGADGLPCTSCHGEANFRNVPGNPKWHLAPAVMAWEGKSLAEICRQIRDPARNGEKSLDEIVRHMADDELVAYGWEPPDHLAPAPGNQALFGQLSRDWVATGAHCPEP